MCIFFSQDGTIPFRYRTYGVDETTPYQPELRVRPNNLINLVAPTGNGYENQRGNWGFRTGKFDWNARDDKLASSPLWSSMWLKPTHHVIVPMTRAFEATTRRGPREWFAVKRRDDGPLLVPGLGRIQKGPFRTEWHVTVVTVDAGPVFDPIHDTPREIVCLRGWDEATAWMKATGEQECRTLLRAAGTDLLESYPVHPDVFKEKFPAERCAEPYVPRKARNLDAF
jgi:putative SOS response-associated peptidase YedK